MTGTGTIDETITPAQNLRAILALDYDHFVECAFLTILNRSADSDALEHYVERLKAGHSKLAILSALYKSDEARAAKVQIPWIRSAILRHRLTSLPVVRLAFTSDRRDLRLEFEHRLHAMEKTVSDLAAKNGALTAEVSALSRSTVPGATRPEYKVLGDASTSITEEMSGESTLARRVFHALSAAIADNTSANVPLSDECASSQAANAHIK